MSGVSNQRNTATMNALTVFIIFTVLSSCYAGCHLYPSVKLAKDASINLGSSPTHYVPSTTYPVYINCARPWTDFIVTLDGETSGGGSFQIIGDPHVSFSEDCSNTLVQTVPDSHVSTIYFLWNSPSDGCVSISAALKIDGAWEETNTSLCPVKDDAIMGNRRDLEPTRCCACDHAKYKIVFEGIWSSKTHPKDFPVTSQFTHFSDVIGASHSPNFTMWREGEYATYGFQQLAEYGVVRELEMELRNSSRYLRSIVRATGLWWPHVNSNTTAQFTVDPRHHLFSVASMFGPSPDWVVGLSSLNLCETDCTWLEGTIIDLYPYDAGTDEGVSYQSPKVPTTPHERIRRITTMYPEDPRAPFYNLTAENFPPIARIYITRDKVVSKKCSDLSDKEIIEQVTVSENTEDEGRAGCEVGSYSKWSECSVTCGKGIRMRERQYLNSTRAEQIKCDRQLISREMCVAEEKCEGDDDLDEVLKPMAPGECDVTPWSDWSDCTVSCGIGMRFRQRSFVSVDERVNKKCSLISMMEKEKCMMPNCRGGSAIKPPTSCATTEWSDWSTCSATCGEGLLKRVRSFKDPNPASVCKDMVNLEESVKCRGLKKCALNGDLTHKICLLPLKTGPCRADFPMFGYDVAQQKCVEFQYGGCRGNRNNFKTLEDCQKTCETPSENAGEVAETTPKIDSLPRNCVVSKWSQWSQCYPCLNGTRSKTRQVVKPARNGGRGCPALVKTIHCSLSEEFCQSMQMP